MNSTLAVQKAVRRRLIDDPGVAAILGGRIHDNVPQDGPLPYATVGDIETRDWSTQTSRGHEHMAAIHVWTAGHGRRLALDAIGAIDSALAAVGLDAAPHRVVTARVVFWTVLHDLENERYHGLVRLRVVTEDPREAI
jgi:hypothetical protein